MKDRYCAGAFCIGAILWWLVDIAFTVPSDQYGHLILVILLPPVAWLFQFIAGLVTLFVNPSVGAVILTFNLMPFWLMGVVYVLTPRRHEVGLEPAPALEDGQV